MKTIPLIACMTLLAGIQVAAKELKNVAPTECKMSFKVTNTLAQYRASAPIYIPLKQLGCHSIYKDTSDYFTKISGEPIQNQQIDNDHDGIVDSILLLADFEANTSQTIEFTSLLHGRLRLSQTQKTQAEMAVRIGGSRGEDGVYSGGHYQQVNEMTKPEDHVIGNKLFKYEGFGWESDQIAYRFYFDERGLIDIFGKLTTDLVLQDVGLDGSDYHALADWGMDILKVGSSLGLGGIAAWQDNTLIPPTVLSSQSVKLFSENLQSSALLEQRGWQLGNERFDIKRYFSITAGSHLTHAIVSSDKLLPHLAVGIVKHGVERLDNLASNNEWNYIATYGQQSLANDQLGMAVFFRQRDLINVTSDTHNELVILKPSRLVEYYFGARWAAQKKGVENISDFKQYLESVLLELNNPIEVLKLKP
ncbi:DUF4861 domain-containing protein [Alishewanella sp. 16-MA]|uniref:DUF4861 domain-containing protein n=1 Tax=Alishewanella maricola TaxID=2795740 RepID=A0ABS8C7L5_9ALTE|nr:DUF4861 family protein [Alishewanella maricola]MCB5228319.1 DUF4861 domain-containing protein [Alishewanella maricola]